MAKDTEFGGGPGLVQGPDDAMDFRQQTQAVYATNEGAPEGSAEADPDQQRRLGRIGRKPPRESYTPHWGGGA